MVTDAELSYYGSIFVNHKIRENEGITFEQYLKKVLGDRYGT